MNKLTILVLYSSFLTSIFITCVAVDTIALNQTIKDGETIVSSGEAFELGFFSPGGSKNRYVGIWYKKISTCTVVWVANTEEPLTNTSGELRVSQSGLQLFDANNNTVVWSTNSSGSVSLVAQLQDTGNLVLLDQGNLIWQSFDYPGDTLLPGMRIGIDLVTGKQKYLTSWKSDTDPSAGQYVLQVAPDGYPQLFETRNLGSRLRFGPWNGVKFSGMPDFGENSIQFVFNGTERFFEYKLANNSLVFRTHLRPGGNIENLNWIDRTQSWRVFSTATVDNCYSICGPNGECNVNNVPACNCLEGFEPRRPDQWNVTNWSSGCQRIKPLVCGYGDSFRNVSGLQFPDTSDSWYNQSMTLVECEAACKSNCTCMAYANSDIRNGGSGCLLWFGDLTNIRAAVEAQTLYIRMHASELESPIAGQNGTNKKQTIIIVVSATLGSILVCLILALYLAWRKKEKSKESIPGPIPARDEKYTNDDGQEDTGLLAYSLSIIAKSTNNFSLDNKLGEGGFGPVYKGLLEDGQEIAVKQLSETSTQGLDEFKNEVRFIAKLQHRNLVKLLGYCVQGKERMLIYEYMANKSLDSFIFDAPQSATLDWPCCFRIIHGIARGLLYLHHESRLRIVHRDLKASNILLDKYWNPKISDFGLARRFSGHESEANTNKVVGTYGYISPEYALHGVFSVKSDVYSFGVLMLEIVSGKKNRGFSHEEHDHTLIGYAWTLFKEDRSLELMSVSFGASCVKSQVLRSIHIGLLCVQHHPEDRPTMSSVVLMLGNNNALPQPKQPAFFTYEEMPQHGSVSSAPTLESVDEDTITLVQAR